MLLPLPLSPGICLFSNLKARSQLCPPGCRRCALMCTQKTRLTRLYGCCKMCGAHARHAPRAVQVLRLSPVLASGGGGTCHEMRPNCRPRCFHRVAQCCLRLQATTRRLQAPRGHLCDRFASRQQQPGHRHVSHATPTICLATAVSVGDQLEAGAAAAVLRVAAAVLPSGTVVPSPGVFLAAPLVAAGD
jgi:hypothetical protein